MYVVKKRRNENRYRIVVQVKSVDLVKEENIVS